MNTLIDIFQVVFGIILLIAGILITYSALFKKTS